VGLITHKDCERAMAEALGIPAQRTGHFSRLRGSNALEDCDMLLVVGTPAVARAQVARLARAYYHADPEVIDESERARREWCLALPRSAHASRVANALIRAEVTQCAHRNRPLRYDGRMVVTRLGGRGPVSARDAPCTSLPQLTPEGLPLALERRAAEETRMVKAVADLEERGEAVTSRALAASAHISLNTACTWLRQREAGISDAVPMLSVREYCPSCTSDNIPAVKNNIYPEGSEHATASGDPPSTSPAPPDGEPLLPARPVVCPAASAPVASLACALDPGNVQCAAGSTAVWATILDVSTRSVGRFYPPALS
jgi:hypothetical protein